MMIGLCSPIMAQNNDVTLKIIETSDIHGSFFSYDFITHLPKKGSMARVSTYINELRKKYGDQNVYLLDNGDILQGQPISCLLYTSPSPRDRQKSRMPSSA